MSVLSDVVRSIGQLPFTYNLGAIVSKKKLHCYQVKFEALKDNSDLTEEEVRLFILVNRLIDNYDDYAYLENDEDYLRENKEYIDKVIKIGKMYND